MSLLSTRSACLDWCSLLLFQPPSSQSLPKMAKAWCDTQHDRNVAFNTIIAPFTKIPVKRELTELFLDVFGKAARGWAPRCAETDPRSAAATATPRPACPSSASVPACD